MNKLLLCTALGVMTLSSQAQAREFKPYMGIDFQRMNYEYNNSYNAGAGVVLDANTLLGDSLDAFNVHVGSRFHNNFGVELGYFHSGEDDKDIAAGATVGTGVVAAAAFSTSVKVHGLTLDGLGYLPVVEDKFDLIGTVGLSWSKAEAEITIPGSGTFNEDESEIGFRAGVGGQFNVTEKVNLRAMARYQSADFDDIADNAWIYSVGFNFNF